MFINGRAINNAAIHFLSLILNPAERWKCPSEGAETLLICFTSSTLRRSSLLVILNKELTKNICFESDYAVSIKWFAKTQILAEEGWRIGSSFSVAGDCNYFR